MNLIYEFRRTQYPDVYEQRPYEPPSIIQQVKQDAYTFRPLSIQTPPQQAGRTLQGKPKLSVQVSNAGRQTTHDASPTKTRVRNPARESCAPCGKTQDSIKPAGDLNELRNLLIYEDEIRREQQLKNDNEIKQMTELDEKQLEQAMKQMKGAGYRFFKSKLATGAKQVRDRRKKRN